MGIIKIIIDVMAVGVIATAIFDLYLVFVQPRIFKAPFAGFALVGRWILYFPRGRLAHDNLAKTPPIAHENPIGWIVHYAIGVAFAGILLSIWKDWRSAPTIIPAMMIGIASVLAPFCLMQPAFGHGFFASRTPNPWQVRLRSIVSHTVFGLCLYAAGIVVASLLS